MCAARTRRVNLGDAELPGADRMARDRRILYVVNAASRVTVLELSKSWVRAWPRRQVTSSRLRFPTTVAIAEKRLLVVNSQSTRVAPRPELPFTVAALRRP